MCYTVTSSLFFDFTNNFFLSFFSRTIFQQGLLRSVFFFPFCSHLSSLCDFTKTQNIFLTSESGRYVVKLGDFGISKVLETSIDLARTVIGTPYYMSPELLRNKPYGYKSDIWSLGCVLYEMMCLKHAFEGRDYIGLVNNILKGQFPPVPTHYSQPLKDLLAAMLTRSPEARPSAAQLLKFPLVVGFMTDYAKANRVELPLTGPSSSSTSSAAAAAAVVVATAAPLHPPTSPAFRPQTDQPVRASGALRQRIEERKPEAAVSPARMRLMRELETTRHHKEVIASKIAARQQRPLTAASMVAEQQKKHDTAQAAVAMSPEQHPRKPKKDRQQTAPTAAAAAPTPSAVATSSAAPFDPRDRPQSAAEERKQLLERRWKDIHERGTAPVAASSSPPDSCPRKVHTPQIPPPPPLPPPPQPPTTTQEDAAEPTADVEQLEAELEQIKRDEKKIEESIDAVIQEDHAQISQEEFARVVDSFAEHAEAPACPAGDLVDDDDDGDEATEDDRPSELAVTPRGVSLPRLPGTLSDRVRVLRQHCIEGLGEILFNRVLTYVQSQQDAVDEDDPKLLQILGPLHSQFARALLSLAFTESTLMSTDTWR